MAKNMEAVMAHVTRRRMLTGSLMTVASGVCEGAYAVPKGIATPEKTMALENKFLVTPQNPIAGGDAVPVGIKIASAWLRNANVNSAVTAKLQWNGAPIAVFTLGKLALGELNQDVKCATRIKIPADTAKGKLSVEVASDTRQDLKGDQSVDLEISRCDECTTPENGQLVLATQLVPLVQNHTISVKSYVPKPVTTSRVLKGIDCLYWPGAQRLSPPQSLPVLRVDVVKPNMLSDEVFLAVDFLPPENGLLEMLWTYNDANSNLQARAYLTQTS
jgi:hypothetical protein